MAHINFVKIISRFHIQSILEHYSYAAVFGVWTSEVAVTCSLVEEC